MKLEEGKRYVTRNGEVTPPLMQNDHRVYCFTAQLSNYQRTWDAEGFNQSPNRPMESDLVTEYSEHEQLHAPGEPSEWMPEAPDMVNSPPHYQSAKGIESIDAIEAALTPEEFRGFLRGNCLKYLWRCEKKGGTEDLKKAAWYLNRLTETPKP